MKIGKSFTAVICQAFMVVFMVVFMGLTKANSFCLAFEVLAELGHKLFEFGKLLFQGGVFRFQFLDSPFCLLTSAFQFLVQALDRRQRHAGFVHGADGGVIFAYAEGCMKILCHRTHVPHAGFGLVTPGGHWQGRHPGQDRLWID